MDDVVLQVSDFIALTNQTLEFAYPTVVVEGEVSSFNVNQNKFVFFDLKDEQASVSCFMMVFHLKVPLEDGMKVQIQASPKLTNKGRFSLTVKDIKPVGEGSLKRAYELLKSKLEKQGIFDPTRKRTLPVYPARIGVIASETSAGWADFKKIANDRWGGVEYRLAHVQVQGDVASEQIVAAVDYFNSQTDMVDFVVLIRGGGSLEDLAAFNSEEVAIAVAKSRIPTVVGVGHEVDVTLAGLAADVRASTPSNAAQLVLPDREFEINKVLRVEQQLTQILSQMVSGRRSELMAQLQTSMSALLEHKREQASALARSLAAYDPRQVLKRGYSIIRAANKPVTSGKGVKAGDSLVLELDDSFIDAEAKDVSFK